MVSVVEALVIIQDSVRVVRSGSMYKVMKTYVCRHCMNPVIDTRCTSIDISVNANLELLDKFCYLGDIGDMLNVD